MSLNLAPEAITSLPPETLTDAASCSREQSKVSSNAYGLNLAQVEIGKSYIVDQILVPETQPDWAQQLEDIGFIAGEPVAIMARGMLGGDPLVVRIGLSTFALRRSEAQCVQVLEAFSVDVSSYSQQLNSHSQVNSTTNKATR
jgi:ferrous iron transport protein A